MKVKKILCLQNSSRKNSNVKLVQRYSKLSEISTSENVQSNLVEGACFASFYLNKEISKPLAAPTLPKRCSSVLKLKSLINLND